MEPIREEPGYQGWTNHATWCVALHIDNDQPLYQYWRSQTAEVYAAAKDASQVADKVWTVAEARRFLLADRLKDRIERETQSLLQSNREPASLALDLLNGA